VGTEFCGGGDEEVEQGVSGGAYEYESLDRRSQGRVRERSVRDQVGAYYTGNAHVFFSSSHSYHSR